MLSFLLRKQIDTLLERAYQSNIEGYKSEIRSALNDRLSDEQIESISSKARKHYIEAVSNTVSGAIYAASADVIARYKLALYSPEIAGAPPVDELDLSAGVVYCLTCYAITGKPGKTKDAIRHNHLFASYVEKALYALNSEQI